MRLDTILLAVALVVAGAMSARAQGDGAATSISPATHCIDRITNTSRLKTAPPGSYLGAPSGITGSAAGGTTGTAGAPGAGAQPPGVGSSGADGMGGGAGSQAGVSEGDLQPCP